MHLAFLTPEYPHAELGISAGIGTSIKNLAKALLKEQVEVTVFVYNQSKAIAFRDEGVVIHAIAKKQYKIGGWFLYRKYIQRIVNRQIALCNIDAIEAPDWTGITAFMSFKCPLFVRFHGSDSYYCKIEGRKQKKKNFLFEKQAVQNADHLISVSQYTADITRGIFNIKDNIEIIPNGVDVEIFKPGKKEMIGPHKILYFGTIIRKKGVLEIPTIFNLVNENNSKAELYIAGPDTVDIKKGVSTQELMEKEFESLTKAKVHFLGKLGYEQIIKELQSATVVILPSFAEAFPMTWIEAMAMEKALVTSDIGWAKEVMIDGRTGFTVNPKKHQEFANRIISLLENEEIRNKFGKAARDHIKQNFSSSIIAKKNMAYYLKILEQ